MTERSHTAFLSYASQGAQAAQRICEALRAAGFEVWFDQGEPQERTYTVSDELGNAAFGAFVIFASKVTGSLLDAARTHAATRNGTQCESTGACRYRGR